jgi:hypothetical protein
VKGFNHLIAATLAANPIVDGGRRVVFLSSDDEDATAPAAALAKQLGFAPVKLGKPNEGGALVHARGRAWGQLIFRGPVQARRSSNRRMSAVRRARRRPAERQICGTITIYSPNGSTCTRCASRRRRLFEA